MPDSAIMGKPDEVLIVATCCIRRLQGTAHSHGIPAYMRSDELRAQCRLCYRRAYREDNSTVSPSSPSARHAPLSHSACAEANLPQPISDPALFALSQGVCVKHNTHDCPPPENGDRLRQGGSFRFRAHIRFGTESLTQSACRPDAQVILLDQGKIVEFDTPAALLANPNTMFHALCKATGKQEFAVLKKMAGV